MIKTKAVEFLQKFNFKSLINSLPEDAFERSVQDALF